MDEPPEDIWDEIERRLRADYEHEESMAGNTKTSPPAMHPLLVSVVGGLVVGLTIFACTFFFGDSRTLAGVAARVELMQKQLELLASRPYISRDEFERELSRLDRRVYELERTQQPKFEQPGRDPRQR